MILENKFFSVFDYSIEKVCIFALSNNNLILMFIMDWEGCKFKNIAEIIPNEDVNRMIDVMIDNCDISNNFIDYDNIGGFIESHVHSKDFFAIIERTIYEEYEKPNSQYSKVFSVIEYNVEFENELLACENEKNAEKEKVSFLRNEIYRDIIKSIEKTAREKRKNRLYFRLNVGDKVDFNSCTLQEVILEKNWFYKDGGWGVANSEGFVIVRNHLVQKPEWNSVLFDDKKTRYIKIQDRDTGLYGVLSLESYKEVIHCLYDEINCVSYWDRDSKKYVLKVKKNDKWGCYDDNCTFIIDCKYDDIHIIGGWIECCRDGSLLYSEYDYEKYESIYNGLKDLYTTEGILLLGGYNHFEYDYKRYFKFYFGIQYEEYSIRKSDSYGNEIELCNYRLNYNDSLCIVLDDHFRSIIKNNGKYVQIPRGITFNSRQELCLYFPNEVLFNGHVELSDFNRFIYITKRNGEKYVVSDYVEGFTAEILGEIVKQEAHWNDILIEDDEVLIIRLLEDGSMSWRLKVNEIGPTYSGGRLFRQGKKVGFFSWIGVSSELYSAITVDFQDKKTYVAKIVYQSGNQNGKQWNPNFIPFKQQVIQYFELLENGELKRMKDDWKEFNPKKHKWFPQDFLYDNRIIEDYSDSYCNDGDGHSYEKYGGYNGYDDDTIDYGFDGYPEATWNVD
jgi:hypothetical protein